MSYAQNLQYVQYASFENPIVRITVTKKGKVKPSQAPSASKHTGDQECLNNLATQGKPQTTVYKSTTHTYVYTRYHNTNWYQVHIPLTSCKTQRNTFLPSVKRSSFSPSLPPSCRASQEAEVFLIWHKALSLLLRQIQFGTCPLKIIPHLSNLASSLARFGEDKASEGILGVIGLGKKSTYSCE